ncbi:transglycosylase domain-containing protein [Flammeovirga agarivorans]|uniref:Glycosyltransferase n=1 Tax=Flammeovirga agarivorans TaxID=2726742 RepID=A0A7X8XV60_9BACT|nr:transglycosylase domain-containing protein [Flammeovirga agarivorans]NLR90904.1 glycosyltransferase [Flammeovirga agarivorans]
MKNVLNILLLHKTKVLGIILGLIGLGCLMLVLFLGGFFGTSYSDEELLAYENEVASLVYSDEGKLIGKFFAENRTNVSYQELPTALVHALVATEDARYFEHEGVDSRSVLRVLVKSILLGDKSSGGGSTITQQLAKNMYGRKDYGPFSMLINKSGEIKIAHQLERLYNKEEILSLYLNTVPFGESIYGIGTASQRFFNKKVEDLKTEEAAVLIGMLKANTYYNPRLYPDHALKRRNVVLNQMLRYDYLTQKEYNKLSKLPLKLDYANKVNDGIADYYLHQVKKHAQEKLNAYNEAHNTNYDIESDGLLIETTLNIELQQYVLNAFKKHLSRMQQLLNKQYDLAKYKRSLSLRVDAVFEKLNRPNDKYMQEYFDWDEKKAEELSVKDSIRKEMLLLHAGFMAMDTKTGEVKAYVGGIDFNSHPYDQITAKRQLASTFKPILYATAIEDGTKPCKYLKNEYEVENEDDWKPANYSKTEGGMYSVAASLAKSLNIPTVNLYKQTSFDDLQNIWQNLGFSTEIKDFPSTALGTMDASVYELCKAYAAFANHGKTVQPEFVLSIKTPEGKILYEAPQHPEAKQVFTEETAMQMSAILQKGIQQGTGASIRGRYSIRLPLAGKTGTSQNYGDAWFASFSPDLVMVTRVGASSNAVHFSSGSYGAGSTLALPITAFTLQQIQKDHQLSTTYFLPFPALPHHLSNCLDCEDYKEDTDVKMFFNNIFKTKSAEEKKKRKEERKEKRKKRREKRYKSE